MLDYFAGLNPVLQALLAGLFTWGLTALGAAGVFFSREPDRRRLDGMLGFAAGVMLSASFWSLLLPAIELSGSTGLAASIPAAVGFLAGGVFLRGLDALLPHIHPGYPLPEAEGPRSSLRRTTLLVIAITMHNIPEGFAVGVAFGAVAAGLSHEALGAAIALTIGIGLQNFPEGFAVSAPLAGEGYSRTRSFMYGQLSAIVEPIAAVFGAALVFVVQPLLPYALAFAAGAMIFVVGEEVIPESQRHGNTDLATMSLLVGFVTMMILDVTFS
ncbi:MULTISPECIES: ZIP family metal transporter [unclassified Methanoculleus]|jgi:ZIP family zinc transporter|uniref:ZIP family metal transporter n=1 Tax=unclassified Methanoculleus TaxID=2619537 RepID=UPI0025DA4E66|nr:ZIP family metal transporter [Methanoculleus sp. UBA377]MDD2474036.1 ZIP family metal transporter [Methanoculleus sp.]